MLILTAAASMPALIPLPRVFDAKAYLADMDEAGIEAVRRDGWTCFMPKDGSSFGKIADVDRKWAKAARSCPNCDDLIAAVLS